MTVGLRVLLAALGAVLVLVTGAAPASAHNNLRSTDPVDGASFDRVPERVVLTFDEPAVALGTQVVVTGPDGDVASGAPALVDATVSQALQPGAPAGRYTVSWRVTSADGHPISGTFAFRAAAAAPGDRPSAASGTGPVAPTREPLIPSWGWIAAGILFIAGAVRMARRHRPE